MQGRKPAPHVARSIAVAQAKPGSQVGRKEAVHVSAATVRPGAPAQAKLASPLAPAPHVAAAIARPSPQLAAPKAVLPKVAPVHRAPAAHLAAALASRGAAQAKPAASRPPAAHVAAALSAARAAQAKSIPARPAAAAHVAAAAARGQAAPPPAARPGVVQRSQAAWLKRKQGYVDGTQAANQAISTLTGNASDYFKLHADVPADSKASIIGLTQSGPLALDQDASQMVNFSYSLKERGSVEPELQTALIRDKTSKAVTRIRISANTSAINSTLAGFTTRRKLGNYYKRVIRPHHVERRLGMLEREASLIGKRDLRAVVESVRKSQVAKGDPSRKNFYRKVNKKLALLLHQRTRKAEARKRMKSARGFAFDPRYTNLRIHFPDNTDNYHAESAIQEETDNQPNEEIERVYGTKVPCLACQAFFQGKGVRALLMDHSSFAWLSKSSLKQLGFTEDQIKEYLLHIRTTLGTLGINEYGASSGEIMISDLTVDADPASDSEDEDARTSFKFKRVGSRKKKPSKKDTEFKMEIETVGNKHFT